MEPSYGHSCPLPAEPLPNTRTNLIGTLYCPHVQLGAIRGAAVLIPGLYFFLTYGNFLNTLFAHYLTIIDSFGVTPENSKLWCAYLFLDDHSVS